MKVQPHFTERGSFNYVTAILLLLLVATVLACVYIVPKYYANFWLGEQMWALMVKAEELDDQTIETKTLEAAVTRNIPLPPTQLQCSRSNYVITCHYEFEWPVGIPGVKWNLKFAKTRDREVKKIKTFGGLAATGSNT